MDNCRGHSHDELVDAGMPMEEVERVPVYLNVSLMQIIPFREKYLLLHAIGLGLKGSVLYHSAWKCVLNYTKENNQLACPSFPLEDSSHHNHNHGNQKGPQLYLEFLKLSKREKSTVAYKVVGNTAQCQ